MQFKNSGNQNSNLLQRNSTTNTTRRVVISTSVGKKIVLQFKDSSSTTGREISALPGKLGKTDKRSEYFADSQGISNSIPLQTKTKKGTKGNKLFYAREGNNLIRSGKSLEEGCCGTSLSTKEQFLSNIFIVKKKDGGNGPVNNLKELNQHIPFLHFKMESLQFLKTLLQKNEYMCKLDLKDAYLCVPLSQDDRKRIQFKRNDYFPFTEKNTINKTDVPGYVSESRDSRFRVNKGVRSPDINNFGHSFSKTPLSFSPTVANSGTEEK